MYNALSDKQIDPRTWSPQQIADFERRRAEALRQQAQAERQQAQADQTAQATQTEETARRSAMARPAPAALRALVDAGVRIGRAAARVNDPYSLSAEERTAAGLHRVTKTAQGAYTDDAGARGEQRLYDISGRRVDRADPISRGMPGAHRSVRGYYAAQARAPKNSGFVAMGMGRNALRQMGSPEQIARADAAAEQLAARAGVRRKKTPEEIIQESNAYVAASEAQERAANFKDQARLRQIAHRQKLDEQARAMHQSLTDRGLPAEQADLMTMRYMRQMGVDPNTLPSVQVSNAALAHEIAEQNRKFHNGWLSKVDIPTPDLRRIPAAAIKPRAELEGMFDLVPTGRLGASTTDAYEVPVAGGDTIRMYLTPAQRERIRAVHEL